ncbi:MAG: AmmeMemoRadiSam system radical SAM enzyme [Lachnospiraceae bacterium]|nr:AmmeMemoRadiSam system radical SAM enzyme [Lachnospiraceae bacterium]
MNTESLTVKSEAVCPVCFRHCHLREGQIGFCGGRIGRGGRVEALNYGKITSLALDPIEKKPLARFFPGSRILSAGSFGCNLRCPFCQNYDISWSAQAASFREEAEEISPEELAELAERTRIRGNIGVAFTYNEPLIGYEFIRDTVRLLKEKGLKTVLVTNGTAELPILQELLPLTDAMNIDLKGFTDHYYSDVLGGNRAQVMAFIEEAVRHCHVELTTLIVPGENDSEEEMRALSAWVAALKGAGGRVAGPEIPLHISRFFPRFHMTDRRATPVKTVYRLADVAREKLAYVYTGNC